MPRPRKNPIKEVAYKSINELPEVIKPTIAYDYMIGQVGKISLATIHKMFDDHKEDILQVGSCKYVTKDNFCKWLKVKEANQ